MAGNDHWMQSAVKRPGAFTRKAKEHGMSVRQYAQKVKNDPNASTRTKRQAALARTFEKTASRRRSRSSSRRSSRR